MTLQEPQIRTILNFRGNLPERLLDSLVILERLRRSRTGVLGKTSDTILEGFHSTRHVTTHHVHLLIQRRLGPATCLHSRLGMDLIDNPWNGLQKDNMSLVQEKTGLNACELSVIPDSGMTLLAFMHFFVQRKSLLHKNPV